MKKSSKKQNEIIFQFYPKNEKMPEHLKPIPKIFEKFEKEIGSKKNKLPSNKVLSKIRPELEKLGYKVEKSKKKEDKIKIPVLFGRNSKKLKSFDVDAFQEKTATVIEVEAGRAVTNYQFLKDLFSACVMIDVEYLIITVRKEYKRNQDFDKVEKFMDVLYISNRLNLPLKGILIIGY